MSGEKTEQATPKRRRKAKNDGKVAKSADFTGVIVTISVAGALVFAAAPAITKLLDLFRLILQKVGEQPTASELPSYLNIGLFTAATALGPILAVAFIIAAFVTYTQIGPVFTVKPLVPDANRLNPAEGLKRMFSKDRLVDLLKNSIRLILIGAVAYILYLDAFPAIISMTGRSVPTSIAAGMAIFTDLGWSLLGVLLVFGVVDLLWQRHSFEKSIMMSKQEVKDEYKESEGDPMLKGKRRQMHKQMLREAEVSAVRQADALVVNPTHVAVGLRYDATSRGAPYIVARGRGDLAQRLREEAERWNVPIIQNVPLARALVDLELEEEIPEDLYEAVAEVLKFVYSLRKEE